MTESWQDVDGAVLGFLRSAEYNVVDCPRPRTADDMSVNHGGVVVIAASDITLSPITVADQPGTFQLCSNGVRSVFSRRRRTLSSWFNGGGVSVL